jgi:disulfide bond formation protein DsbB
MMESSSLAPVEKSRASTLATAALLMSLAGSAGSLYLSLGMGLKACPLCFYQRSFMMATAAILLFGRWLEPGRSARMCALSLPLVVAGLGVAVFHTWLVGTDKLECPAAVLGWGDAPAQSLVAFLALTVVSLGAIWRSVPTNGRRPSLQVLGAIVLGSVMAWVSVASAPPLPPSPTQPYDPIKQPLDMCRPPYRGAE